jgi:ferrous iron transport protein B
MVLEVPAYRMPRLRPLAHKVWLRLKEFIVIAWPILIVGSIGLSLLDHFDLADPLNRLLAPFTQTLLGLPSEVGITLVCGLLRKELAIAMLGQALGTNQIDQVMTHGQMLVFTAFSIFYVPCLATLTMLRQVVGLRHTLTALLFTTLIATLIALGFRLVATLV